MRVNHHLLGVPGATLETVRTVESHVHALGQCRDFIRACGYRARVAADTAGAAADVAAAGDPTRAAIASRLAAEIYGLQILKSDIEDAEHNTTRFLVLAREPRHPGPDDGPCDHHLRLPGPQPPGGPLQGAGRVRDQRREHDQARELPRQRLHAGRVLCRHHGPSGA